MLPGATGVFARLRPPLGFSGIGASSRRRALLSSALLVLLSLLALLTAPALASEPERIGGPNEFPANLGPGGLEAVRGLAISAEQGGDIYVVDAGSQRVSQFTSSGAFVRAFGWGIVPGAVTGTGDLASGSTSVTNVATATGRFLLGEILTGPAIPANTRIELVTPTELQLSKPASASTSGAALAVAAGPGNVPVNEVQTTTLGGAPTGGTFTLAFTSPNPGSTAITADIPYDAEAGEVEQALAALSNLGAGNLAVSGPAGGPWRIEFKGRFADVNLRRLSAVAALTPSGTVSVGTPTEGAGALETCTTACAAESIEEGGEAGQGTQPGQLRWSDGIAVDNSCSQHQPPLTAATTPTCAEFDPSYGDIYVVDQRNFRVEKYSPDGHFLLMIGGEVDKTTSANICTAADLAGGDLCGEGVPGMGPREFYDSEPSVFNPAGEWSNEGNNSIAVGPDGTVYIGDYQRVQEIQPDGTFAGQLTLPDGHFVGALAVDKAGNIFERSANYDQGGATLLSQVPGVREYNISGTLVNTLDAENGRKPTHVAVDSTGDVFISEYREPNAGTPPDGGFEDYVFRAGVRGYKPTGALYAEIASAQVQNVEREFGGAYHLSSMNPLGIAAGDAAGNLYATATRPEGQHIAVIPLPQPGPPVVVTEPATDIQPKTATLHGTVNPDGFDTEYYFQYVDAEHFQSGGFSNPATQSTASTDLGAVIRIDPAQAAISGLTPATTYHFRLVAESHCNEGNPSEACVIPGVDQTFETLPPVSIRNFTTQTVGPELVTVKAELNPNGSPGTYRINIGKGAGYGEGTSKGVLPISNEFEKVTTEFTHLEPNTLYHYQLEVENDYTEGRVLKTADQSFTTEQSAAEERAAEDCPNTNLREENNSLALPDCRAYEQVSVPNKAGGEAFASGSLSPGGERYVYLSQGVFAGAVANELTVVYLAQRTPSGWTTIPVIGRPAPVGTEALQTPNELTFSPELDRWLFGEIPAFDHSEAIGSAKTGYFSMGFADGTYLRQASATYNVIEGEPRIFFQTLPQDPAYRSDDLSHVFFVTNSRLLASDPRPDGYAQGTIAGHSDRIYEFSGLGGVSPTIRLVAELPLGLEPSINSGLQGTRCAVNFDESGARQNYGARLTSRNGSTMVYSSPLEHAAGAFCGPGTPNPVALFVHYEGQSSSTQLDAVSPTQCHAPSPCASSGPTTTPTFAGLSPDGTGAWFTTTQPLIDSDTDSTRDLYLAKLESGNVKELVLASTGDASPAHPTPGQGADVQGVVRVSDDGTHVAFVGTGVLTTDENALHQSAIAGADNLYVYDAASGQTKFVAKLCSGPKKSGSVTDIGCLTGDEHWLSPYHDTPKAAFTPDGRYLLLASFSRLTADDTDNTRDIYRYDFQTGQLIRLSFGHRGNDGNGNDDAYQAEIRSGSAGQFGEANQIAEDSSRSIAADGSVAIFFTQAPLVSHDTNNMTDIYEWEEQGHGTCHEAGGCIGLVSDGVDTHDGGQQGIISASGRDITFHTQRGEVPADTDGVGDIYDARVNGGFHYSPPPAPCGSPEACRPSTSPPPPSPKFTTEGNVSGGNGVPHLRCAKGKHRVNRHGQVRCVRSHHRKQHHRNRHHERSHPRAGVNRRGGK
jgi:hypothetical protein